MRSQLHWQILRMVQMKPKVKVQPRVPNLIYLGQKFDTPSRPQGIIDSIAINLKTCRLEIRA